jgi:MtN3 and saliva related transmembrane protein
MEGWSISGRWNCYGGLVVRLNRITLTVLFVSLITLCGCEDLIPRDTQSLFVPRLLRSEIFGFAAGLGTTFAAVPDLVAMLRRKSSAGMNPRMAAIMSAFQILWVYYGLLLASRPVIAWNVIAVFINSLSVGAYFYFARKEKARVRVLEMTGVGSLVRDCVSFRNDGRNARRLRSRTAWPLGLEMVFRPTTSTRRDLETPRVLWQALPHPN